MKNGGGELMGKELAATLLVYVAMRAEPEGTIMGSFDGNGNNDFDGYNIHTGRDRTDGNDGEILSS